MGEIILLQKSANLLLFWYWIFVNNSLRTYTKVFKWTWTSQFFSLALCKSLLFFHICKELWPFKQLFCVSFYWALTGFRFLNLSQSHLIGKIPETWYCWNPLISEYTIILVKLGVAYLVFLLLVTSYMNFHSSVFREWFNHEPWHPA